MAVSDFHSLRKSLRGNVTLSTAFFGERVIVQPPIGPQREITAHVQHSSKKDEEKGTIDQIDRIVVKVSTDERDPTTGGIADAKPGYVLWRSETIDADRRPYQFAGQVLEVHPGWLRLVFERSGRRAQGAHP